MLITKPAPCWVLTTRRDNEPVGFDDGDGHYGTRRKAAADLAKSPIAGRAFTPRQLTRPCVLIECDQCGTALGQETDDYAYHCEDRADAEGSATASGWTIVGDTAQCHECICPTVPATGFGRVHPIVGDLWRAVRIRYPHLTANGLDVITMAVLEATTAALRNEDGGYYVTSDPSGSGSALWRLTIQRAATESGDAL